MVERNYASELAAVQSASPPTSESYADLMRRAAQTEFAWSQYANNPGDVLRYLMGKPPITSEQEARIASAMPDLAPTQAVKGIVGGLAGLAQQANQAMPWGGNDPSAIGIDTQTGSIDPSVMVPFATNMAGAVETGGLALSRPVSNAAGMGIRAYHGSPHDFERFSMDKIGTGEGAQAYGHGLYMAEAEKTGKAYRDQLSDSFIKTKDGNIRAGDAFTAMEDVGSQQGLHPDQSYQLAKQIMDKIDRGAPLDDIDYPVKKFNDAYYAMVAEAQNRGFAKNPGHMYEVDIDASPDEFLDWDKPLSEQPAKVREAILSIPEVAKQEKHQTEFLGPGKGLTGSSAYAAAAKWKRGAELSPSDPIAVTEALRAAGIKGIRYLDEGSRGLPIQVDQLKQTLAYWQGEADQGIKSVGGRSVADEIAKITKQLQEVKPGTSNYVVFDDKTISILKKYGLAGLTAGGAGAAMLGGGTDQASATEK